MAGDITRITLNVHKFYNSETIEAFSNEELGQYVRLMCKAILLGKEASLPDDRKVLAKWADTTPAKLSDDVLKQYPLVLTEFGPRRRNAVLYEEWCRVCKVSEDKSFAALAKKDKQTKESPLKSTNGGSTSTADAQHSHGSSLAPGNTVQYSTVQYSTEQNSTEQNTQSDHAFVRPDSIGAELDEVSATIAAGNGVGPARGSGHPGFFKRGQYPGTDPKRIWAHCSTVYRRIVGESGYLRYPTKHPQAQTDKWADLCQAVSSDLIVPAFELWVDREGKNIKTQWALAEFLKGETASLYLEMISPLNEIKPKVTQDQVKQSAAVAKAQHETLWAAPEVSTEPGPEAF